MLYLIEPETYDSFRHDLDNMYRFRHKIFVEKMHWDVNSQEGMERDEYDENQMYYLIYKDNEGIIRGCIRFTEMTNPCMMDGPFKSCLPNIHEFKKTRYWETSRFGVDTISEEYRNSVTPKNISKILLAGLIEFGLYTNKIECYLSLSYSSVNKLLKKYGLFTYEVHSSVLGGERLSVYAFLPTHYSFNKLIAGLEHNLYSTVICNLNSQNSTEKHFN